MTTAYVCDAIPMAASPRAVRTRALLIAGGALAATTLALVAGSASLSPAPAATQGPFSVGLDEGGGHATGLVGWILATQSEFYRFLTASLQGVADGAGGAATLIGLAFLYGVFHAAGPGHGKAVIAAWMFANERSLPRGLGIAAGAALLQAIVAVCLVGALGGILRLTADGITGATAWVEAASFLAVAAIGASLLLRKSTAMASPRGLPHGSGCACHVPPSPASSGAAATASAVVAAGARPCSGAIIVLAFSLSLHAFATGVAAAFAMAVGTAVTTGGLACLAVKAKGVALTLAGGSDERGRKALLMAEVLAAALVCSIGLCLLVASIQGRPA